MNCADLLKAFVDQHTQVVTEQTVWGNGTLPLQVSSYLGVDLPALELISSVRGIVTDGKQVLVMRNTDETHIVPGGRREAGETLEQTLRREIAEESGWLTDHYRLLGVWHFRHLSVRSPEQQAKYPNEFMQLIYAAAPVEYRPDLKLTDDYEIEAAFVNVEDVLKLNLNQPSQIYFLRAALGLQT